MDKLVKIVAILLPPVVIVYFYGYVASILFGQTYICGYNAENRYEFVARGMKDNDEVLVEFNSHNTHPNLGDGEDIKLDVSPRPISLNQSGYLSYCEKFLVSSRSECEESDRKKWKKASFELGRDERKLILLDKNKIARGIPVKSINKTSANPGQDLVGLNYEVIIIRKGWFDKPDLRNEIDRPSPHSYF